MVVRGVADGAGFGQKPYAAVDGDGGGDGGGQAGADGDGFAAANFLRRPAGHLMGG